MAYLSICSKYGPLPMIGGYFVPFFAAFPLAQGHPLVALSGVIGIIGAFTAELASDRILHAKNLGVSKGSKIKQAAQALAYTAVCGTMIALGVAFNDAGKKPEAPQNQDTPVKVQKAVPRVSPAVS